MTAIVRPSGGRWNGVDYVGNQRVTDSSIESSMVNAGFASWASGSGSDLVVPAQVRVRANGAETVDSPKAPGSLIAYSAKGVSNLKASNTTILRNMLASAGFSRGILQFIGDSYSQGRASMGNGDIGARAQCWPVQLIKLLVAMGVAAQMDSVCGMGSVNPTTIDGYVAYDPRVSYTGTVAKYAGIAGLGYEIYQLSAGATLTFTPGTTFDTCEPFWAAGASGASGTFTVSDAGGVKATIDCSLNAGAVRTQVVTLAANSTYVTFTATTTCNICFWKVRTAGAPGIEAINCGQAGKPINQWSPSAASAPYGTQASLNLMDGALPVVTVVNGWYNDLKQPRTLSQLATDLRALCTWVKSKGELWYVNYARVSPAQVDDATFALWSATVFDIVVNEFDGVFCDVSALIPNNAVANTQGLISSDLIHMQKGGHSLAANMLVDAMLSTLALSA